MIETLAEAKPDNAALVYLYHDIFFHTVALVHSALGMHVIGDTAGSDFKNEFRGAFKVVIRRDP